MRRYLIGGPLLLASAAALAAGVPTEKETGVTVDVHVPTPEMLEAANQRMIAQGKVPDSPGTGPYRVIRHVLDNLPDEVVYQPADLSALGDRKMPIYLFGNGACSTDATKSRHHLIEIASHGYLVITREWTAGSTLELELPMPIRTVPRRRKRLAWPSA